MNHKINALRPGQSVEISRTENGYCTAERSGDGETLRYVRHTCDGFQVFKTCRF